MHTKLLQQNPKPRTLASPSAGVVRVRIRVEKDRAVSLFTVYGLGFRGV